MEETKGQKSKTDWILCCEEQPKATGYYLVDYEKHFVPDHADSPDHCRAVGTLYYDADHGYGWGLEEIYAWMPKPETYKGGKFKKCPKCKRQILFDKKNPGHCPFCRSEL